MSGTTYIIVTVAQVAVCALYLWLVGKFAEAKLAEAEGNAAYNRERAQYASEEMRKSDDRMREWQTRAIDAEKALESWEFPEPEIGPLREWTVVSSGNVTEDIRAHDFEIDPETRTVVFYETVGYSVETEQERGRFVIRKRYAPDRVKVYTFNLDHVISIEEG